MCSLGRTACFTSAALIGLTVLAPRVSAQSRSGTMPPVEVEVPRIEGALGLTINSLGTDVNAEPRCAALSLPCTHAKASSWGGFGLDGSAAVNLSRHAAFVGAASAFAHDWDSPQSLARHRPESDPVRSYLAGPRIGSGFSRPRGPNQESDRFFGQLLAGFERSTLFSTRPVVQVGGGVDTHTFVGRGLRRDHEFMLRMEFDYRIAAGAGEPATGYRFLFGAVFGPRFGDR
jgi:hypothetical protein